MAKRAEPLGVQVVDVRLRRIEFAPEISESVYRRMEAERTRVANELRSIGGGRGREDPRRSRPPARGHRGPSLRQGAERHGRGRCRGGIDLRTGLWQNPQFYTYYKSLEAYRASFSKPGDVLVVDPSSSFFQFMKDPGAAWRR